MLLVDISLKTAGPLVFKYPDISKLRADMSTPDRLEDHVIPEPVEVKTCPFVPGEFWA